MTGKEIINQLMDLHDHCASMKNPDFPEWDADCEALEKAIEFLRNSLTREQVEKVWRGERIKHDGYTECSGCEYWYPSTEDEEEGDRSPFCPACGRPMTDKAVDMVMERWKEAMKDG